MAAAAASPLSRAMSAKNTRAPASARVWAVARPIPEAAPVTIAVLSLSFIVSPERDCTPIDMNFAHRTLVPFQLISDNTQPCSQTLPDARFPSLLLCDSYV